MRSYGVIILLAFTSLAIVKGDDPPKIKNFCDKFPKERCDQSQGVRKQCPDLCGTGGQPQPQPQPQAQNSDTTKSPSVTTKSSSGSSGGKCDKRSPCIPLDQANANFRQRCQASGAALKDTCYDHCRYDESTADMKHDFLSGPCPLAQLRTYLTAASNGKDNTQCCQDTGVLSQKKTGVCACFCNPTGPVWPGKGEAAKYAPCVNVLEGIMKCHQYAEGAD